MKKRGLLILSNILFYVLPLLCIGINNITVADQEQSIYTRFSDSVKIFNKYYTENDLENVTPEFLRYARNYFFAKHGYIFKDSCLNVFYKNQSWYKPNTSEIILSEDEKMWVDRIMQMEENYSRTPPLRVVSSYYYNQRPLFYIVSALFYNKWEKKDEYHDGFFYLLKHSDVWILSCQGIPPELIQEMSSEKIRCSDDPDPLRKEDIQVGNFDQGCLNSQDQEIIVRLYGPSNDDGHNIIGFDAKENFSILIKDVFIQSKEIHSDSIIRFESQDRCDRIGTEFCIREYDFNTITRKVSCVTKEEYQHIKKTKTRNDSVRIFKSEEDALERHFKSIAFIIPPNSEVHISHFLDKKKVYLVEYNNKIGWIGWEDLHKFWVSFAD